MGPIRSTGCRTCVKRRVKCDETRPFCQRCARVGVQCDGFPPPFTFVDETQETTSRFPEHEPSDRHTSQALVRTTANERNELRVHRQLSHGTDRQDIYFSYLLRSFFAIGTSYQDHTVNRTWMTVCLHDQDRYPTANLGMVALATGFFGRKHSQEHLVKEAATTYGKALLALARDLEDPEKVWGYDALAATMALGLYEHVCFTSQRGWIQHAQGVAKLIEMRGPERFQTYPERAILEINRSMLILQSLVARKRCFLERPAWQSTAWFEPGPGNPMLRLLDIFAHLPGVTEDIQNLQSDSVPDPDELERAQANATSIVTELTALRSALPEFEPIQVPTTRENSIAHDDLGPIFATHLVYPSLDAGHTLTTLNAAIICALEWQHTAVHDLSWTRGPEHQNTALIPGLRVPYARDICRSVDFLLMPRHLQSGAFYLLFPARVAYLGIPRESREARWVSRVLVGLADSSGFEMARNVLSNVPVKTMV